MTIREGRRVAERIRRGLRPPVDARLVFLHVPKCGGNSVRIALREAYRRPLASSQRRFFHVSPRRSRRVAEWLDRPVEDRRDELLRYHLFDERVRLATGHFRWPAGLRRQFPEVAFATVLRDPVSHFLSAYFASRDEGASGSEPTADLEGFLESAEAARIGARFVRTFAGPVEPGEAQRTEVLDRARRRLVSVELLGVLEDLPAFADEFERRFGARLRIPHANAGPSHSRGEPVEAIRARIVELVRPNQMLYDCAMKELARRREAREVSGLSSPAAGG